MKIVVDKRDLVSVMNVVLKAIPNRSTMPIQECVLIDASQSPITVMGNDFEIGISSTLDGAVKEPGRICIEAKLLNEIAKKLPDGDVKLDADLENNSVKITCGKAKFTVSGKDAEDFTTTIKAEKDGTEFDVSQLVLRNAIQKTAFCTDPNGKNAAMTGELFRIKEGSLRIVALDGHRIAIRNVDVDVDFKAETSVIIPARPLVELSKVLTGSADDTVHVNITKNHCVFEFGNTVMIVRLIAGDYFRYEQLLNIQPTTQLTVYSDEFLASLNRASIVIKEGSKHPLVCDISDDVMHTSVVTENGSTDEDISVSKTGADIRIGFNTRFLIEAINAIDDNEISMHFINAKSPVTLKQDDSDEYIYIVLPVNL